MAVEVVTEEGPEFRRETGYGVIRQCKATNGQRNAEVVIKAEQLDDPIRGWVDTVGQRDIYVAGVHAFSAGQRIFYRIETHRKKDVADDIPFADLTKHQKVREVMELTAVNGDGVPLDQPNRVDTPPGQEPAEERRGPRIEEAKPWQFYNSDTSLNLGSYAVQAAEAMVLMAHDLLLFEAPGDDPPTPGKLYGLARCLLRAADHAQASARADGHADRMDNSHTRARSAVKAALAVHPVPWGADEATREQWVQDLSSYAADILDVVVQLVIRQEAP